MMRRIFNLVGYCGVSLLAAGTIFAQAPPGPLPPPAVAVSGADRPVKAPPPPKPRTSIMGAWKLNHDDSDDPGQKMRQAKNGGRANNGNSGPHVGMGIPGVGMGGGGNGRQRPTSGESDADREHMLELLSPGRELMLAQKDPKDPEIDVSDERDRKLTLFTDGRKLEKSKTESYQQVAAHWDDSRLVTDEKTAHGATMSRTFELSSDGLQLWETVKLTTGKKDYPVTIRYVYDQLNERAAAEEDPDVPVLKKRTTTGSTSEQ